VGGGGIGFLPSIWQVDPATDECKPVYIGLNSVQDYAAAYQQGISVGIRGMCVYKDQLVVSNVTMDAATGKSSAALLISSDPEKGFTQIADSDSLFNYPAYHYADSIYGGVQRPPVCFHLHRHRGQYAGRQHHAVLCTGAGRPEP